ncbi:hypothetical protein E4U57_001001 [Claviceps arundinis]|uniref:Uncharacterized protein n=1 Tax=Claviceps arundinis TaxID=1623583 RepID=A0ABQ7PBJ3_9HYPO|nr:hypothetical protein E4U57_001001 [Claviceps arundinis]
MDQMMQTVAKTQKDLGTFQVKLTTLPLARSAVKGHNGKRVNGIDPRKSSQQTGREAPITIRGAEEKRQFRNEMLETAGEKERMREIAWNEEERRR